MENDPQDLIKIGLGEFDPWDESAAPTGPWNPPTVADLDGAFPEFTVDSLLGRGGMGAVYRATRADSDDVVAIKILPPELAGDPILAERFALEIAILQKLDHPNLVKIFESGPDFFVMEFLEGGDLSQEIQQGKMGRERAIFLIEQIGAGLAHLHENGLLHRDLKPSNLLLSADGDTVKIGDFGLVKMLAGDDFSTLSLTQTGAQVGTSHYLAPELLLDPDNISERTDLYALGVVFYQLVASTLPVGHFQPLSKIGDFSARADRFVERALDAEPAARFGSVAEFLAELKAATEPPKPIVTRRKILTSGSVILVGAGIGAWWKFRPPPLAATPEFSAYESYPWTDAALWGEANPATDAERNFVADRGAHLVFHSLEKGETFTFGGRSLTLKTGSSAHVGGQDARIEIADLRMEGGALLSDVQNALSANHHSQLRNFMNSYPGPQERQQAGARRSNPTLEGSISVTQPSIFSTGPDGAWPLRIEADIRGAAPLMTSTAYHYEPVVLAGDNSGFTGGWFFQSMMQVVAENGLGTGGITIEQKTLEILESVETGPISILAGGRLAVKKPCVFESLTVDGIEIAPGDYEADANFKPGKIAAAAPFTVKKTGGETPDIFLPKTNFQTGGGVTISATKTGRWDDPEIWDGPAPEPARFENGAYQLRDATYCVPAGVTLHNTPHCRGLEMFSGKKLVLEKGARLEFFGNEGFLIFNELRLAGGVCTVGATLTKKFSIEAIGGRIFVDAPTVFELPNFAEQKYRSKYFKLHGKLMGEHDVILRGGIGESIYQHADLSDFSGTWQIEGGKLGGFGGGNFSGQTVILDGKNSSFCNFGITREKIARVEIRNGGRLEPANYSIIIAELLIDGEPVPPGIHECGAPELKGSCQNCRFAIVVGEEPP